MDIYHPNSANFGKKKYIFFNAFEKDKKMFKTFQINFYVLFAWVQEQTKTTVLTVVGGPTWDPDLLLIP